MNITFINRMMGIKFGGGENFDLNMARALKKRGYNIRFVIGICDKYKEPVKIEKEFEIIKVKTPYFRDIHYKVKSTNILKKIISVSALEFDLWLFENKVLKMLKNDEWSDVYQICGLPRLGALLKNINKNKLVSIRWPGPPSKRKLKWIKQCDINFANGDALKIIKEKLLPECKEVNLGIDIEKFCPVLKEKKDKIDFLFVGRIVPIKNLSFLIKGFLKAYKENSNIVLNIVGDGEGREINKLKILAKGNKSIKFLGKKTGKELIEIYQMNDVFCITSLYDNYPNAVFEAMACGLPVIATKVGGIPMQVIDNVTGILIELNNIEQLKDAILRLANNKELRERMGEKGRKKVENEFSWDKSSEKLEEIYKERL
jgi:glycosyltransferase involved in cell wall biosynthesis